MTIDCLKIGKEALEKHRAKSGPTAPGKTFPHCPKCGSYYLWRKDKIDPWDCETCGEHGISDEAARRVQ